MGIPAASASSAMAPSERGPPGPAGSSWAGVGGRAILASHSSAGPFCQVSPAASAKANDICFGQRQPLTASQLALTVTADSIACLLPLEPLGLPVSLPSKLKQPISKSPVLRRWMMTLEGREVQVHPKMTGILWVQIKGWKHCGRDCAASPQMCAMRLAAVKPVMLCKAVSCKGDRTWPLDRHLLQARQGGKAGKGPRIAGADRKEFHRLHQDVRDVWRPQSHGCTVRHLRQHDKAVGARCSFDEDSSGDTMRQREHLLSSTLF